MAFPAHSRSIVQKGDKSLSPLSPKANGTFNRRGLALLHLALQVRGDGIHARVRRQRARLAYPRPQGEPFATMHCHIREVSNLENTRLDSKIRKSQFGFVKNANSPSHGAAPRRAAPRRPPSTRRAAPERSLGPASEKGWNRRLLSFARESQYQHASARTGGVVERRGARQPPR